MATHKNPSGKDRDSLSKDWGTAFANPAVANAFDSYAPAQQATLLALRELVFDVAAQTPGVGPLDECLKWGQPSYLTTASGSGSTLRMGPTKDRGQVALFVHCQTKLADTFRQHYEGELAIEGKRALLLDTDKDLPEAPLRHCIALALTYHQRKKA
ncbi:DUF1801 domain-containing protein [Rhodovibrionaceae bacterium A322]